MALPGLGDMKRLLLFLRRRLLLKVRVAGGVVVRPGDTVLVSVPGLPKEDVAVLRSAFEKNHPGVRIVFLIGLDRLVVLNGVTAVTSQRTSQFSGSTSRPVAGFSPATVESLASGDTDALLRCLWFLARKWFSSGGSMLPARDAISMTKLVERSPEQRAFLAAGCDLYDVLISSPQGREALLNLGLQPVRDDPKGE